MATAAVTATYRVVSINETGTGRVTVNFSQEFEDGISQYGNNPISLNLTNEEASGYFPGQTYTVSFTPA